MWIIFMQIKQFEYVQEIAECKSITQAAQKLYISQQALSEALKLLETELDFKIFERSNKGVIPTAAGKLFLQDLDYIMPIVYGWRKLAISQKGLETIKIRVQYVLSDLLINVDFLERLNRVETVNIEWETLTANDILYKLEKEELDIGLLLLVPGSKTHHNLHQALVRHQYKIEHVMICKMVLVLNAKDILAQKRIVQARDVYGKKLATSQIATKIESTQRVDSYTGNNGYYLPPSVNVFEFILQHEETFAFFPEFIAEKNIHVKNGSLVLRTLEEECDNNQSFYLIYNNRMMKEHQDVISQMREAIIN